MHCFVRPLVDEGSSWSFFHIGRIYQISHWGKLPYSCLFICFLWACPKELGRPSLKRKTLSGSISLACSFFQASDTLPFRKEVCSQSQVSASSFISDDYLSSCVFSCPHTESLSRHAWFYETMSREELYMIMGVPRRAEMAPVQPGRSSGAPRSGDLTESYWKTSRLESPLCAKQREPWGHIHPLGPVSFTSATRSATNGHESNIPCARSTPAWTWDQSAVWPASPNNLKFLYSRIFPALGMGRTEYISQISLQPEFSV